MIKCPFNYFDSMKYLYVLLLTGFFGFKTLGQSSLDIGAFGGIGTYLGDMTSVDFQKSIHPAYGGFLRYNFNPRYSVRFNAINGTIGAEGNYNAEVWSFNKNVLDLSLLFEFNYLKYIVGDKLTPWSTFLFCGVGLQTYNYNRNDVALSPIVDPSYFDFADVSGPVFSASIPFGLGVKDNLTKRVGIGLEFGMHKSFSDKLDDLNDPQSYQNSTVDPPVQVKYTDYWHNNDWSSYLGFHLVYKLLYGNRNWEMRTPRNNMIDWGIWNSNKK